MTMSVTVKARAWGGTVTIDGTKHELGPWAERQFDIDSKASIKLEESTPEAEEPVAAEAPADEPSESPTSFKSSKKSST